MGAFSKIMAFTFATLLAKPFKNWKAFKMGLIDEKGNKIKEPKTPNEKESLSGIKDFVRKVKRLLIKVIPDSRLLGFLITLFLLKRESESVEISEARQILENNLTKKEIDDMVVILKSCQNIGIE